jgi:hypothetical protein
MSDHIMLLTLFDDLVLIATWQPRVSQWYNWGSVHLDAFFPEAKRAPWYHELQREGKVIVNSKMSLNVSMQLPPDNLA